MLTMRMIGQNDYSVREDGQPIGRIRYASERTPGIWIWNVQVNIPGPPFGSTASLDEAKAQFRAACLAFKCQSAFKFDPASASNFDPFERRVLTVALGSSELAGVAETRRARAA